MFAKDLHPLCVPRYIPACFIPQMLYLSKCFIAGVCKQAGEGEMGCFCTRVGGEGAIFQRRVSSSGWSENPAGGRGSSQLFGLQTAELALPQSALVPTPPYFYRSASFLPLSAGPAPAPPALPPTLQTLSQRPPPPPLRTSTLVALLLVSPGPGVAGGVGLGKSDFGAWSQLRYLRVGATGT